MNKDIIGTIDILNRPSMGRAFWRGLGGHFGGLTQILNEFIDNSFSNFMKYQKTVANIVIYIEERPEGKKLIRIEDSGNGIENLTHAFELGNQEGKQSSLNEHGFGLKHALASANPKNDSWKIYTRTEEDAKLNQYKEILAPYEFENFKGTIKEGWSGKTGNTGTIIEFVSSKELFSTITQGLPGNYTVLESFVEVLAEDLGYVYSYFINENIASLSIEYTELSGKKKVKRVEAVEPPISESINPGKNEEKFDLGSGLVALDYMFGRLSENNKYKRHYRRTMSSSGVEIRINGRLMVDNLFKEIWGIEKHNSYNYLIVSLNIISDDAKKLPNTTTSKTGIRQDDPKLTQLYTWIKGKLPNPKPEASLADDEVDLFKELAASKKNHLKVTDIVTIEEYAYSSLGEKIRIDLFVNASNDITIYEGKKDITTPKDVYQLLMYWDGLVYDKLSPSEGVLLAASHPESVKSIVKVINERMDSEENKYNIKLKTWNEEGIQYPN